MKIGIFGAEQKEVELLEREMQVVNKKEIAGLNFFEGNISGKSIVLVCGGIGKVNAALCSQILISEFGVELILNTGTAGALLDDLNIFDIVVSTDAVQHDVNAVEFGYPLGQVPMTESAFWKADEELRRLACSAFDKLKEDASTISDFKSEKIIAGRIASGDAFIAKEDLRNSIIKNFQPACAEMEGAAVAQVCVTNKIPYLILRSICDNAGKTEPAKISYEEFSKQAAKNSAMLVLQMLKMI